MSKYSLLQAFTPFGEDQVPYSCNLRHMGRTYNAMWRLVSHWWRMQEPRKQPMRAALGAATATASGSEILPSAGNIVRLRYEELVRTPEAVVRQLIVENMGLPWDRSCLHFTSAAGGWDFRTASASQVKRAIYNSSVGRWRSYAEYLEPLVRTMRRHGAMRTYGYNATMSRTEL